MCGGVFGSKTPKIEKIAPTPQAVTTADTEGKSVVDALREMARKRGLASTMVASDRNTVAGGSGKKTLG